MGQRYSRHSHPAAWGHEATFVADGEGVLAGLKRIDDAQLSVDHLSVL